MNRVINDIYYTDDYIRLYLKDKEEIFSFEYKEEDNIFVNKAIKREILKIGKFETKEGYYDLETAYGYGGFYTNSNDESFIKRAFDRYKERCHDENIIAEFIRFHPFNSFPIEHSSYLDFNLHDRNVVVKDLNQDILSSYSSKVRNVIKRACEKISFRESCDIDKFIELYNATMLKNSATEFYFFPKSYYQNLLKNPNVKLYEIEYENSIVAMGFFMFGDKIAHYHLSANTNISYKINANNALLHYAFLKAKESGLDYMLLGGGTTSQEDDSLLRFKKKFSKELKPFYISGNIYNKTIYDKYNKIWQEQSVENVKYFLKYRLEI